MNRADVPPEDEDELFLFDDDDRDELVDGTDEAPTVEPWLVLVVDDDREVHAVTRVVLSRFRFMGRPVALLDAYSAREAEEILRRTPGIALILLDVVMERDDAGLTLVRKVREGLGNHSVRIILRTGQPGMAPEMQVINDYDINDYRAKTELTQERLCACLVSALRSYHHIQRLETNSRNLTRIIDSAANMFRSSTLHRFLDFTLAELLEIVGGGSGDALFCARQRDHITLADDIVVVNGFGRHAGDVGLPIAAVLERETQSAMASAIATGRPAIVGGSSAIPLAIANRWSGAILLPVAIEEGSDLSKVVALFATVMTAALENFYLLDELRRSTRATVVSLADLAEHRDTDTGEHVLRVARLASEIAWQLNDEGAFAGEIDPLFLETIGTAAMLHDIGKVGIPDHILLKPGRLDAEERRRMETHARIGGQTLDKARRLVSSSRYLDLGHEVALRHHERFDGGGYPDGLKGDEIPLSARIVAVADVFDALITSRPYKPAWRLEDALTEIVGAAGRQFDPAVVEAFSRVMTQSLKVGLVRWTPDMSVGAPQLDEDHRRLFNLINLLAANGDRHDRSMIETVIEELSWYTESHFSREEEYMRDIRFPNLDDHVKKHRHLADQVSTLRTRFHNGLPGKLSNDIIDFLSSWLSSHILEDDRQYSLFHNRRTGSAASH